MPAIITHDFFGRDVYGELFRLIGGTKDEAEAFLLGSQGPDPLFYLTINPLCLRYRRLGSTMHKQRPTELLSELKCAVFALHSEERAIGRAYAMGFLCHYALDRTMHPFIYASQFQLCDAGVEGLSRADGREVHALIEGEFDEMMLFTRRGETIASFDASREILRASEATLETISTMYARLAREVYEQTVPKQLFAFAVHSYRLAERVFRSPSGIKREALGRIEELVRPYSFYRAMSCRDIELTRSAFDNREHVVWKNPFSGEQDTSSFFELYDRALTLAKRFVVAFDHASFGTEDAWALTGGLNFSGKVAEPSLSIVEEKGGCPCLK